MIKFHSFIIKFPNIFRFSNVALCSCFHKLVYCHSFIIKCTNIFIFWHVCLYSYCHKIVYSFNNSDLVLIPKHPVLFNADEHWFFVHFKTILHKKPIRPLTNWHIHTLCFHFVPKWTAWLKCNFKKNNINSKHWHLLQHCQI